MYAGPADEFREDNVTVIDNDIGRIRNAARFGFKVFYGDGTRLDVLHASGANEARIIAVCVDKKEQASLIVELVKQHFPLARVHVRAFDRIHAIDDQRIRTDPADLRAHGHEAVGEIDDLGFAGRVLQHGEVGQRKGELHVVVGDAHSGVGNRAQQRPTGRSSEQNVECFHRLDNLVVDDRDGDVGGGLARSEVQHLEDR